MNRIIVSIAIALGVSTSGGVASADDTGGDLARAISAIDEVEYDVAWLSLQRALKSGDYAHDGLVLIYKLSGQVSAAFGNTAEAYGFFRRMLALEPRSTLESGLAPKIRKPFERAKKELEDSGRLVVKFVAIDGEDAKVKIAIESDPLGMVVGAKVAGESIELPDDGIVEIPRGTFDPVVVAVTDRYGNHLDQTVWGPVAFDDYEQAQATTGRLTVDTVRAFEPGEPETSTDDELVETEYLDESDDGEARPSRPLHKRWYTWGVLAAGSAAIGAYFGMRARADWRELDGVIADSGNYSYRDAMALESSGHDNQMISNVGFGAAALFAAVAVVNVSFDF